MKELSNEMGENIREDKQKYISYTQSQGTHNRTRTRSLELEPQKWMHEIMIKI